eukprot:scpid46240/ scgid28799/ 
MCMTVCFSNPVIEHTQNTTTPSGTLHMGTCFMQTPEVDSANMLAKAACYLSTDHAISKTRRKHESASNSKRVSANKTYRKAWEEYASKICIRTLANAKYFIESAIKSKRVSTNKTCKNT